MELWQAIATRVAARPEERTQENMGERGKNLLGWKWVGQGSGR